MSDVLNDESAETSSAPENPGAVTAPVLPDELINGDWSRSLVLPNRDGQLRLTSVKSMRRGSGAPSTQIRYLDEKQRHSA